MIIYQIKLPVEQDPEAFATFMRKTYFPAVHRGATRIGQVVNLTLFQATNGKPGNFILHLDWTGLAGEDFNMMIRTDDDEINKKFKLFNAHVENIGTYEEIVSLDNHIK